MPFRAVELERSRLRTQFRLDAVCRLEGEDSYCGHLTAERIPRAPRSVAWRVNMIAVDPALRRQGIATRLYEAAAAEACRRKGPLVSTARELGAFSNEFWEKQVRKGCATVRETATQPVYTLSCPVPASLAGARRR